MSINKLSINIVAACLIIPGLGMVSAQADEDAASRLNYNEQIHLEFMREEEKLARDVYLTLGKLYPKSRVFGKIDDSEQRHTDAVKAKLLQYGAADPNTNDNIGVYTGEDYGWYFEEKYDVLVEMAKRSELDAMYVGAFIEELDMLDIGQCPKIIVETDNGIDDSLQCGLTFTDKRDLQELYNSLMDGSENHLRSYVRNIEAIIGRGKYEAQVLSQDQVDRILGR